VSSTKKLPPGDAGNTGLPDFDNPIANPPDTTLEIFFDDGDDGSFPLAAGDGGGSISVSAAKPVASIAQLSDYLVNGFWAYNSALSHHWFSSTITYNIAGLNPDEQFLARSALAAWHDVANVNFVETSGSANITFTHNGTMQAVTNASWFGSGAMASATVNISTDWVTTDGGARDGKTGIDSYAYQTYIHEIGHALGLGHQGPYNGSANYSTNALFANDTWQYSIMSYFSEPNYSGSSYRYVVTPQMADIYAVATMYGAATTTRTGDTVYGFNSNAGAVFGFGNYTSAPAFTIYDSGGSDTLDCSLYSSAQRIDLHAGAFSSVGGLVNNIGIALNTVIEKAIGGSGNDMLIASDLGCTLIGGAGADTLTGGAGIDRLAGGSGIDTMTGGGGADSFVFAFGDSSAASNQHDRITDFVSGTDHIDISAIDAIASTGAQDLFRFLGSAAFDGAAGALNYVYNGTLGVTTLQGDTNGDRVADFAIDLVGNIAIALTDLIGANVNRAPTVSTPSGVNVTAATAGQVFQFSTLFAGSDADNDTLTYYLYDSNTAANSGHFVVNGTIVPAQAIYQVTAAQLAQTTFVAGTSGVTDAIYVQAFDGNAYSGWNTYVNLSVAAAPNTAPTVSTPSGVNVAASSAGQVFQLSSLFAASDAQNDPLIYYVYDSNAAANSGHFEVNGTIVAAQTIYQVTAAQLAQTTFVAGANGVTDAIYVQAFDGKAYSGWDTYVNLNVAAPNTAPTVSTPSGTSVTASSSGQVLQFSSLFAGSDAENDALTYYLYDSNTAANSGHFVVNGSIVPAQTIYQVTAAQLAQTTFVAGANGVTDAIYVQAFDGKAYSGWNTYVNVSVPASVAQNTAPTVTTPSGVNVAASAGQSFQFSNLFAGHDAENDTLTYYLYDNNVAANSGHFVVNGNTVPAQTIYQLTAAQLAQTSFVAGSAGTADDAFVQAFDGHVYSGWNTYVHVYV
jgi:Ca2+-binding RTX toxin-like protein